VPQSLNPTQEFPGRPLFTSRTFLSNFSFPLSSYGNGRVSPSLFPSQPLPGFASSLIDLVKASLLISPRNHRPLPLPGSISSPQPPHDCHSTTHGAGAGPFSTHFLQRVPDPPITTTCVASTTAFFLPNNTVLSPRTSTHKRGALFSLFLLIIISPSVCFFVEAGLRRLCFFSSFFLLPRLLNVFWRKQLFDRTPSYMLFPFFFSFAPFYCPEWPTHRFAR